MKVGVTTTDEVVSDRDRWLAVFIRQLVFFRSSEMQKKKMIEKGCPRQYLDEFVEIGKNIGAIDDLWYARSFIQSKSSWSIRRLTDELRWRGVSSSFIVQAIDDEAVDDADRCLEAARPFVQRGLAEAKIVGRLTRLGYRMSIIRDAIDAINDEKEDRADD